MVVVQLGNRDDGGHDRRLVLDARVPAVLGVLLLVVLLLLLLRGVLGGLIPAVFIALIATLLPVPALAALLASLGPVAGVFSPLLFSTLLAKLLLLKLVERLDLHAVLEDAPPPLVVLGVELVDARRRADAGYDLLRGELGFVGVRRRVALDDGDGDVRVEDGQQRHLVGVVEVLDQEVEGVLAAGDRDAVIAEFARGGVGFGVRGRGEAGERPNILLVEEEVIGAEPAVELARDVALVAIDELQVAVDEHGPEDPHEFRLRRVGGRGGFASVAGRKPTIGATNF